MKITQVIPLVGLVVLAGCGDPKNYLKEAIQAALNKPFSSAISARWGDESCKSSGRGYECRFTLTYKDISGIERRKDANEVIEKTPEGWRFVKRDIFYGGIIHRNERLIPLN